MTDRPPRVRQGGPISNTIIDRAFTLYGYFNPMADTQAVRLYAIEGRLDAAVVREGSLVIQGWAARADTLEPADQRCLRAALSITDATPVVSSAKSTPSGIRLMIRGATGSSPPSITSSAPNSAAI